MKNKYQEALDNVKIAPSFMGGNTKYSTHLNSATPFLEDISTLQELVDKEKPFTLEEVKKEWEELGYVCEEGASHLTLRYKGSNNIIHIWEDHTYRVDDWLTFQEHQLLTKTFKALGWYDE